MLPNILRHRAISTAATAFTFTLCLANCTRAAAQTTVIHAGTVLDGVGGSLGPSTITVEGGTVQRIEPGLTGTPDYDLSGLTVMPGGIDTHVHIASHFDSDGRVHRARDDSPEAPESLALHVMENAYVTLMSGITTIQSMGARIDGPLRDAIARGELPGPRLLTTYEWITEGNEAELRASVRERIEAGADAVKIFASRSIREGGVPTLTQAELSAACDEAERLGVRSIVHAHAAVAVVRAAAAGCTTVEHGGLADGPALKAMAEAGTFYDPHTSLVIQNYLDNKERFIGIGNYTEEGFAQMEELLVGMRDVFAEALDTPDLQIVFGTDALAGSHGRNWEELIYRVQVGGQDSMDAVISATSRAAASLAAGDRIGTLAPGYTADLIAVEGNPALDIEALRSVVFVMKDGRVFHYVAGGSR
ncbi:MAG: amidohydrolase family protein [Gemmatimonadetes bacterium]|nr:amidohydrolase family protein [Gemmatimonadota bacterium]